MSFGSIYLEPNTGGYHIGHCKIFLTRALADPRVMSVHFVVAETFRAYTGGGLEELSGHSPKVTCEYLNRESVERLTKGGRIPWKCGKALWAEARRLVASRPGSVCFINFFDQALIGSIFSRTALPGVVTGIIHSPPFKLSHRKGRLANIGRWIIRGAPHFLASYKAIPVVFTFDGYYLRDLPKFISKSWQIVPDPVPLSKEVFASAFSDVTKHVQNGRVRMLLFGSLGKRKGLGNLLEALNQLEEKDRKRMSIMLAGEIREATEDEREQMIRLIESTRQSSGIMLEHLDRYLSDEELVDQLNACDVVLAPYADHIGVSGVVIWAAAAGKPIISQDTGWVGHAVRESKLGITCDTSSPHDLAKALVRALDAQFNKMFNAATLQEFAAAHSADDFYEQIVSTLVRCTHSSGPQ